MKKALDTFIDNITNPVTGTEGIRQIIILLIMFGAIHLTPEQQLMVISSLSGVLSLFTRNVTVSTKRVDMKVEELVAHREMVGTTGTGAGLTATRSDVGTGTPGMV